MALTGRADVNRFTSTQFRRHDVPYPALAHGECHAF